jgi:hypothetical protein
LSVAFIDWAKVWAVIENGLWDIDWVGRTSEFKSILSIMFGKEVYMIIHELILCMIMFKYGGG